MMRLVLLFLLFFAPLPLPAQEAGDTLFSGFNLQSNSGGITVAFTVKGGIQCTGVVIERSADGLLYSPLYEFPGVCGNPGTDASYDFLDPQPRPNRVNYYRLSIGGSGLYTSAKSIFHFSVDEQALVIVPNPCSTCTLRFPNEKSENCLLQVHTSSGVLLLEAQTRTSWYQLETGQGLLYITVRYPDQTFRRAVLLKR